MLKPFKSIHKTLKRKVITLLFITLIASALQAHASEPALDCKVIPPILQGYLAHHVSFRKLDSELEKRTTEQFISRLDPTKIYFTQIDVDQIREKMKNILKKIGYDCSAITSAQDLLIKRVEESVADAKKILGDDFKFTEKTEIVLDPKERGWASNAEAKKDFEAKFIQFQISNYLATDMKLAQAKTQLIHRYELTVARQKDLLKKDSDVLYAMFLDAFATSLDAHSGFLGQDTLEDFEISMRLSLEGIGASLGWEDGYTIVESLIPGGSAEKSGEIQPKDKIIAVAQGSKPFENVIDMPLRDVVKLIRGKKGTPVRLTILRQNSKDTHRVIVALKRAKINLSDEEAKLTMTDVKDKDGKTLKIALIDLPSFYGDMSRQTRSCYEDMRKLVLKARKEKADGLILDLSKNGGGLLSEAVRIGGLFIKKGNIVATQDSDEHLEMLADDDEDTEWSGPLVVLTSRLSASASEIVSGALKDYNRALIVGGDHTFGKGTVQAMMNLPRNLGAIKVTTGMFFVPGGDSTQYKGVVADVPLPSVYSVKDIGESSLDYSLPPKSVTRFTSTDAIDTAADKKWEPVTSSLVEKLKALSSARVEKDEEFKKIKSELAEIESTKKVVSLGKILKKQKEEKKKEDKLASRKKRGTDEEYLKVPQVKEAVQIMVDMIKLTAHVGTTNTAKNGI